MSSCARPDRDEHESSQLARCSGFTKQNFEVSHSRRFEFVCN
jgi:hypothetical protein